MNRPSLRWEGIKGEATKLRLHERSERDVLPLHEQLAEKGTRLDLRVLYPFRSLKAVRFHAGCADIELAVEVFHQAFHELGHRRKPLLPGNGFSEPFARKVHAFVHEKDVYLRIKGGHVGRKLQSSSGPLDCIVGMAEDEYEFLVFHVCISFHSFICPDRDRCSHIAEARTLDRPATIAWW